MPRSKRNPTPVEAPVPGEITEMGDGLLIVANPPAEYLVGEVSVPHEWPAGPEPVAEVVVAPVAPAPKQPAEDLPTYAKRIERAAQPLAVCIITHPDAVDGAIFEGTYAGIRLVNGPKVSARLSDGSYI